jgi:predicted O-methyltransferase YrrM
MKTTKKQDQAKEAPETAKAVTEHSWNSEPEVGELIKALINIHSCKEVLEVGVFKGATALSMLGANYTGIDIQDHREKAVTEAMEGHKFILGSSLEVLKTLPEKHYDLIFIDSVHEYDHCMTEFKLCEGLIKKGGLMCFHDSLKFPGVAQVMRYIKSFEHFDIIRLDTPDHAGRGGASGLTIVRCNYP